MITQRDLRQCTSEGRQTLNLFSLPQGIAIIIPKQAWNLASLGMFSRNMDAHGKTVETKPEKYSNYMYSNFLENPRCKIIVDLKPKKRVNHNKQKLRTFPPLFWHFPHIFSPGISSIVLGPIRHSYAFLWHSVWHSS